MSDPAGAGHQQVDGDLLLQFTGQLHHVRDRVEGAAVSSEQRGRWQSRLAAISRGAADDLERAAGQLRRMAAELERHGA